MWQQNRQDFQQNQFGNQFQPGSQFQPTNQIQPSNQFHLNNQVQPGNQFQLGNQFQPTNQPGNQFQQGNQFQPGNQFQQGNQFPSNSPQKNQPSPNKNPAFDPDVDVPMQSLVTSYQIYKYMKKKPYTQYLGGYQLTYSLLPKKQQTFLQTNERFLMLVGTDMICYARQFPQKQELPFRIIEEVLKPKASFPVSEILKIESTNNEKLIIHFQSADKKATVWEFHCPTVTCAAEWRKKIHAAAHHHAMINKNSIYQANQFGQQPINNPNNFNGGNSPVARNLFNQGQGGSFSSGNNPQFVGPNALDTSNNMNFSFGVNNPNQFNANAGLNRQSPNKNTLGGLSPNTKYSPNRNNISNSPLKGNSSFGLNTQPNNIGNNQFGSNNQPFGATNSLFSQGNNDNVFGSNLQTQGGINRPPNNSFSNNQPLGATRPNQYSLW